MQTFLTHFCFKETALHLDNKRLNKQIVEATQILNTLKKIDNKGNVIGQYQKTPAWVHHPAVLMWIGYETALISYISSCVNEWETRYNKKRNIVLPLIEGPTKPPWLTEKLITSHRANLVRKSDFYLQYNWDVNPTMPYYWPYRWDRQTSTIIGSF